MSKKLSYKEIIILSIPPSFLIGPLILEIALVIISILFFCEVKKEHLKEILNNFFFKFFISFSLYLFFSFLIFQRFDDGYTYSVFYFRYPIYFFALYYFIFNFKKLDEYLLKTILFLNVFLILDSFFQFFFGFNFFGMVTQDSSRISSVFGEELVLGSFICKITPFCIGLLFTQNIKNNFKYLVYLIILLNLIVIILSGERSALFLYLLLSFYLFLFIKINIKTKMLISFLGFISLFLIIFNNQSIYDRIVDKTIFELIGKNSFTKTYFNEDQIILKNFNIDKCLTSENSNLKECVSDDKFFFFSTTHENYFRTGINIFSDHIFFGAGPKSFRKLCRENLYGINRWSCSSHPHNYYIQLLTEVGLIGFSFLFVGYILFIYVFFKIIKEKKLNTKQKNFYIVFIGALIINFFPLVPTGNYFNNWLTILSFLPVIYLIKLKDVFR